MSDRELLELAAKAAGIRIDYVYTDDYAPSSLPAGYVVIFNSSGGHSFWNPLTDDGDALRLAVKLGENFPCFMLGTYARAEFQHVGVSIVHREGSETYVEQEYGDDLYAATRRAIVRAAAAIGRAEAASNENSQRGSEA